MHPAAHSPSCLFFQNADASPRFLLDFGDLADRNTTRKGRQEAKRNEENGRVPGTEAFSGHARINRDDSNGHSFHLFLLSRLDRLLPSFLSESISEEKEEVCNHPLRVRAVRRETHSTYKHTSRPTSAFIHSFIHSFIRSSEKEGTHAPVKQLYACCRMQSLDKTI